MIITDNISLNTTADYNMKDITAEVSACIADSGITNGIVTLFVVGSTGALTTIEYESGLVEDFAELFDKIVPQQNSYRHNQKWHDGNGHSHVRASLLGPSLTIPIVKAAMTLGTWQQIVFVDFDIPARQRRIVVQIMGDC